MKRISSIIINIIISSALLWLSMWSNWEWAMYASATYFGIVIISNLWVFWNIILFNKDIKNSYALLSTKELKKKIELDTELIFKRGAVSISDHFGAGKSYYMNLIRRYCVIKFGSVSVYKNFWWEKSDLNSYLERKISFSKFGITTDLSSTWIAYLILLPLFILNWIIKQLFSVIMALLTFTIKKQILFIFDEPDRMKDTNVYSLLNEFYIRKRPFVILHTLELEHKDKIVKGTIEIPENGYEGLNLRFLDSVARKNSEKFLKLWNHYFPDNQDLGKKLSRKYITGVLRKDEARGFDSRVDKIYKELSLDNSKDLKSRNHGGVFYEGMDDRFTNYEVEKIDVEVKNRMALTDVELLNTYENSNYNIPLPKNEIDKKYLITLLKKYMVTTSSFKFPHFLKLDDSKLEHADGLFKQSISKVNDISINDLYNNLETAVGVADYFWQLDHFLKLPTKIKYSYYKERLIEFINDIINNTDSDVFYSVWASMQRSHHFFKEEIKLPEREINMEEWNDHNISYLSKKQILMVAGKVNALSFPDHYEFVVSLVSNNRRIMNLSDKEKNIISSLLSKLKYTKKLNRYQEVYCNKMNAMIDMILNKESLDNAYSKSIGEWY